MTTEEAEVIIGVLRVTIGQKAKEIECLENAFTQKCKTNEGQFREIEELKTKLTYAEDAATKGDLARQQCGGMEMEIVELKASKTWPDVDGHVIVNYEEFRKTCSDFANKNQTLRTQNERLMKALEWAMTNLAPWVAPWALCDPSYKEAQALIAELKPRTEVTPHSSVDAIPEASGTSQLNQ